MIRPLLFVACTARLAAAAAAAAVATYAFVADGGDSGDTSLRHFLILTIILIHPHVFQLIYHASIPHWGNPSM